MKDLSKLSPVVLAETLKRYHNFSKSGQDYSFIRVEFPPLTSEMKYDILLPSQELGANKLNRNPIERRR